MRELLRRDLPVTPAGTAPLTLPAARAEAARLSHLLRLGYDEDALDALEPFLTGLGAVLGDAARQRRDPAQLPQPVSDILKALQDASLCQARGDLIGLADVLEHRVAAALAEPEP